MIEPRIDTIARSLARGLPRRRLLRGLAGGMLPVAGALALPALALAGCKKVGKTCDKNNDCCDGAQCKGKECKCKDGRDECGGKCYKLDSDEEHCGACNNACAAGEKCCDGTCVDVEADDANCGSCGEACGEAANCIVGVCTTLEGCPEGADACSGDDAVFCQNNAFCVCARTTEGATRCGNVATSSAYCGQCESSADCAAIHSSAFCIATGSTSCCGPEAQNVCWVPCAL